MRTETVAIVLFLLAGTQASFWKEGPASGTADDAPSSVLCPAGHYVSRCECKDRSQCDGSEFVSPTECRATANGINGHQAVSVARCTQGSNIRVVSLEIHNVGGYIECPEGYQIEACALLDRWSNSRDAVIDYAPGTAGNGRCSLGLTKNILNFNEFVIMSAICVAPA